MQYKCPKCVATSEQSGNCPTCNVPMIESNGGGAETPQQPAENNPVKIESNPAQPGNPN